MRLSSTQPLGALLLAAASFSNFAIAAAADATSTTAAEPCTATSASGFHDLRRDTAVQLPEGVKKNKNGAPNTDYFARGWDYPSNFTINICAPVVEPVKKVVGIDEDNWRNVSAYYMSSDGKAYSIGQESSALTVRGRKISLQYTNGSPCGEETKSKDKLRRRSGGGGSGSNYDKRGSVHLGASHSSYDDESRVRATEKDKEKEANRKRRKSATFSFICDHEMMGEKAVVSYIGSTPDECAYFFDVRSSHACAGVEPHKPGSVGPGGVFAIIFFIAVGVYVGGGVFYQRTVAHARGWRQLPNYSLWAGIWSFISDFFVIATSSCARCIPGRRGYRTLSSSPSGRGRNREDENRLIDQLDEEWDD